MRRTGRSALTPREVQVMRLVARGGTNREIGRALAITEGTVKGHLHRILRKMRASNRTEAAVAFHRKVETALRRSADADR